MAISISELKREKRELQAQKDEIERKLDVIDRTIQVYSPKQDSNGRSVAVSFNFKSEAESIFRGRGNAPMKMSEIVKKIKENHPGLTDRQIKSKIAYAKRSFFKNTSYGMYNFAGLAQQANGSTEPQQNAAS